MLSFNLWQQVPSLNTKIDFTRLPVALDSKEILVLSRVNSLISLGELASAYKIPLLEMERIVAKLVKNDLILFTDPRVRQELVEEIDESRSVPDHTRLVDEVTDATTERIDRQFEAAAVKRERGEWDLTNIFGIFIELTRKMSTGILRIYFQPNIYKAIFFEGGELINVSSVPFNSAECFGRVLQRAGKLSQEKVIKSLERAHASGRLQGEELVAMGTLREDLLPEMLRVQMEVKLIDIIDWEQGKWEFQPLPALPPRIVNLNVDLPRVLFSLIWKRFPFDVISREIHKRENLYVGRVDNPIFSIDDFYFGDNFDKFYRQILEKDSLVKRVLIVSHMKPEQSQRLIWAMYLTGLVDFFSESREEKTLQRLEELQNRLKAIERETLFDVLGVHWTARDIQIEAAYKKRIAEQETAIKNSDGLMRHLNELLVEHIKIAYEKLHTSKSRAEYRNEIFDHDFIVFGSDILRQKGESYLFTKEEVDLAINELETAVEVYPKDGEYWSVLGLSMFYKHFPRDLRESEEARRMIKRGIGMIPDSEVTTLCMGLMYKREKRAKQATEWLEKVIKINPKNKFARFELEEVKTGKKSEDRDKAVREFLDRRSEADEDFDRRMKEKADAKLKKPAKEEKIDADADA